MLAVKQLPMRDVLLPICLVPLEKTGQITKVYKSASLQVYKSSVYSTVWRLTLYLRCRKYLSTVYIICKRI